MNNFNLEVYWSKGVVCTFYTVRWNGEDTDETNKFFERFLKDDSTSIYAEELLYLLFEKIGNEVGARNEFFRFENHAQALPSNKLLKVINWNKDSFPLRLYCMQLSNRLVILFGGGKKTSENAQGGETANFFRDANVFAKKITEAIASREIVITSDGRKIINGYQNTLKITL